MLAEVMRVGILTSSGNAKHCGDALGSCCSHIKLPGSATRQAQFLPIFTINAQT